MKRSITVIIPAYKAEETIEKTLMSLVLQTDQDFSVIVVEDGDNEAQHKIVSRYCDLRETWSFIQFYENHGCGCARNTGIDRCKTSHLMFLDSDDILMPNAISVLNQSLDKGYEFVAGDFLREIKNGKFIFIDGNSHNTWMHGRLYDRDFLNSHNIRCPELGMVDDTPFNILCREFAVRPAHTDSPLYIWRYNDKSVTRQDDAGYKQATEYIKGNLHYIKTAMRQRAVEKLRELPQVVAMTYFYYDYITEHFGFVDINEALNDCIEIARIIDLDGLMKTDWSEKLYKALLIPNRPYPDRPEPPHITFKEFADVIYSR